MFQSIAVRQLLGVLIVGLTASGCFELERGELKRVTADDAGPPPPLLADGGAADPPQELPDSDPHAVLSIDPNHGPFNGGQRAIIRGNGFASDMRIWFGETPVDAADIVPVDPRRVQVSVPPGTAGKVDLTTQVADDTSTRRTLQDGYTYDSFYLDPASGPTSGGTEVTVYGSGVTWDSTTQVLIDLEPCDSVLVKSPTELSCVTPPNPAGARPVRVLTDGSQPIDVLDAFIYGDSDNGFRGGLSGQPLDGRLRVIAFDSFTGSPVPGATVVVNADGTQLVQQMPASGIVDFADPALKASAHVTLAAKCFQPITFGAVPVDTVTAYLDPVLSPTCAEGGDPPAVGGTPRKQARVQGELVWPLTGEFKRDDWKNVPPPQSEDERYVAYVFRLASQPTDRFNLPSSVGAITEGSRGAVGYEFALPTSPGNFTMYALAGVENLATSPKTFSAFAMGLVRGVVADTEKASNEVFIKVDIPLDHAITLRADGPSLTPRGPDRIRGNVAVRIDEEGYAILPGAQQTHLLPASNPFNFIGIPPLIGSLAGSEYVVTASAVSGEQEGAPRSVAAAVAATVSGNTLTVDPFVELPRLTTPLPSTTWDAAALASEAAPGGLEASLTVYEVSSGGELVTWTIVTPAGNERIELPNLVELVPDGALRRGDLSIRVSRAHIPEFDYGSLRYRQLARRGWHAYAQDVFFASF